MWQALGNPAGLAYPQHLPRVPPFHDLGEADLAFSLWDACGKHFRRVGDSWGLAWTLGFLGRVA